MLRFITQKHVIRLNHVSSESPKKTSISITKYKLRKAKSALTKNDFKTANTIVDSILDTLYTKVPLYTDLYVEALLLKGSYHLSNNHYNNAISIFQEVHDNNSSPIFKAKALRGLGICEHFQDNDKSALYYFNTALPIFESNLGRNSDEVADILGYKGIIFTHQNKLVAAKKCLEDSYRIRLDLFGRNHTRTSNSLVNIANLKLKNNNIDAALALLKEALTIKLATFGQKPHEEIAALYNNIAEAYKKKEDYTQALPYAKQSAQDTFELYASHEFTASAFRFLGEIELKLNKVDAAKKHFETSKNIYEGLKCSIYTKEINELLQTCIKHKL